MTMSRQSLDLLMAREALRLRAYDDKTGRPLAAGEVAEGTVTIGRGHTGADVAAGDVWTAERCDEVFVQDLERFERAVDQAVRVPLEEHQRGALVSFSFNAGEHALAHGNNGRPSSILRALNAGDYAGAAAAFDNWHNPPSVATRRNGEREQFKGTVFCARADAAGRPLP